MLTSAKGSFVVVDANTEDPTFFWRGVKLTTVLRVSFKIDENQRFVKLYVTDSDEFDAAYVQMEAAGITIKKAGD